MKIIDAHLGSELEGVYQNCYFAIDGSPGLFRYVAHLPLSTRRFPFTPYTAIKQIDDGVEMELIRIDSFYPLKHENMEEQIERFFKVAVIS
jgi:hypothetical protein